MELYTKEDNTERDSAKDSEEENTSAEQHDDEPSDENQTTFEDISKDCD